MLSAALPYLPKDKPLKVCGHSLGGGESQISAGILSRSGYKLLENITFGCPLPGDADLAELIAPFPNRSYWNYRNPFHHDIVGDVPVYLPHEPYVMPTKRILIDEPPPPDDEWPGLLAWHHMEHYVNGVKKLYG